jgi:hypothetical protein
LLALERRRIACPNTRLRHFQIGIKSGICGRRNRSIGQFATAKCPTADVEGALAEADRSSALVRLLSVNGRCGRGALLPGPCGVAVWSILLWSAVSCPYPMLREAHRNQFSPALEVAGSELGERRPIPLRADRFVDLTPASSDQQNPRQLSKRFTRKR